MSADKNLLAALDRVQELQAEGHSLRKIAEILDGENLLPPGNRTKWHHAAVRWCLEEIQRRNPPFLKIEVHGPYTAADRRLWGFLLHRAWPELEKKTAHKLPLPTVLDALRAGKGRVERKQLWEALLRLTATYVAWDGKLGQRHRSVCVSLLSATLTEDTLSFHFSPDLLQLLTNHEQYARLQTVLEGRRDKPA